MCWRFVVVCCMIVLCDRGVGLDVRCMLMIALLSLCLELHGFCFVLCCSYEEYVFTVCCVLYVC